MNRLLSALCILLCAFGIAYSAYATERFVSKGNAGAAAPYDTPATVAAEIQAAVDARRRMMSSSSSALGLRAHRRQGGPRGATGDWKDVVVDAAQAKTAVTIPTPTRSSPAHREAPAALFDNTGGGTTNCHASSQPEGHAKPICHGVYNNGKVFDT